MKKFDSVKSLKIFAVIALVLIVAGAFVLGFAGYNKDVRYKAHCEVKVTAEENFGDVNKQMTDTAESVFSSRGIHFVYKETMDDGRSVIYLFDGTDSISDEVLADLNKKLEKGFASSTVTVDVRAVRYNAEGYSSLGEMWWLLLAAGILLILAFFYTAIRYKWAAAGAVALTVIVSSALAAMVCALVRVVITPAFLAVMAGSFAFSVLTTLYFANVIREDRKNVANEGLGAAELVSGAFREVFLKTLASVVALVVIALLVLVLAPSGGKFAAMEMLVCFVCAAATTVFGYGGLYALFAKK
mgnify:CR=1 FL=1